MQRSAIGGFFGLEIGQGCEAFHDGAEPLSNGRACLYVILQESRPAKVYVPFYCCDAVTLPLRALSIDFEYYPITEQLDPAAYPPLAAGEMFLYINYFGIKRDTVAGVLERYGHRAIVDNTHAFFERGYPAGWSFNSARKVFGVPDGGYLYGPARLTRDFGLPVDLHVNHLIAKALGNDDYAFKEFQQSEALQEVRPYRMSSLTQMLLANVDYSAVVQRRRQNFAAYRQSLHELNELAVDADPLDVPFCYPLLPRDRIDRRHLHEAKIFVAQFWKEVATRPIAGFRWERCLTDRLLPLPVDHRLEPADVDYVVQAFDRLIAV